MILLSLMNILKVSIFFCGSTITDTDPAAFAAFAIFNFKKPRPISKTLSPSNNLLLSFNLFYFIFDCLSALSIKYALKLSVTSNVTIENFISRN